MSKEMFIIRTTKNIIHYKNNGFLFFNVLLHRTNTAFLKSVYPMTFRFSKYLKTNLIKTLVHQALNLCSETKLDSDIEFIRNLESKDYYTSDITESSFREKSNNFVSLG